MLRKLSKVVAWIAGIAVFGVVAVLALDAYARRSMPPSMLNVKSLPLTAVVTDCASQGFTEAFSVCTLTVSPNDFPALLVGRDFSRNGDISLMEPPPGIEVSFVPAERYSVAPAEFIHGGSVDVYVDSSRTNVAVYFYEE